MSLPGYFGTSTVFGLAGAVMSRDIADSVQIVPVTTEDNFHELDFCNRCLLAVSWKGAMSISLDPMHKLFVARNIS